MCVWSAVETEIICSGDKDSVIIGKLSSHPVILRLDNHVSVVTEDLEKLNLIQAMGHGSLL